MTTALVVEDDDLDMAAIEDTLCSMQHRCERCTNQEDALKRVSEGAFDYAIIDLRIPAHPDRKQADIEFGGNLLRDIRRTVPDSKLPVIVLADDVNCFTMARWLIDRGVSVFVSKSFQSTHELGDVIRWVLKRNGRIEIVPMISMEPQTSRFTGGKLSISRNEACLLGIPIVAKGVSGHCLNILQLLSQRCLDGSYIARSAEDLAVQIGTLGGQVAVAGHVRSIRRNIAERLPAIIDTPMGRLDAEHRRQLVERYFPHASHQVIVLSTDTESERGYFELLQQCERVRCDGAGAAPSDRHTLRQQVGPSAINTCALHQGRLSAKSFCHPRDQSFESVLGTTTARMPLCGDGGPMGVGISNGVSPNVLEKCGWPGGRQDCGYAG